MLQKKNTSTDKVAIHIDRLKDNIEVSCYHIKANDLKKLLGLTIGEIDDILEAITDIPIKKYRKACITYYLFPIELLISSYMLTKASSVMVKDLTQATKRY